MAWDYSQLTGFAAQLGQAGPRAAAGTSVAITRAAQKVYQQARASAPVGETGNLRDSIEWHPLGPFAAEVEATVYYAAFVEYGTVRHQPEPYLIPAAQGAEADITAAIGLAALAGLR